jgi:AcrR family transcriptional regulator
MFAERGYEQTSVEDIAERLGLLKGSLYHYINGKEDLLVSIISDGMARFKPIVSEIAARDEPPEAKLRLFLELYTHHALEQRFMTKIFVCDFRSLAPKNQRKIITQRDLYQHFVVRLIEDAQVDGSVRAEFDPHVVASSMFGMINSTYQWYKPSGPKTPKQLAGIFCTMLLDGILVAEEDLSVRFSDASAGAR